MGCKGSDVRIISPRPKKIEGLQYHAVTLFSFMPACEFSGKLMTNFFSRIESTARKLKEKIAPPDTMNSFFQTSYKNLVETPNGSREWWHHMPLPNGDRVK